MNIINMNMNNKYELIILMSFHFLLFIHGVPVNLRLLYRGRVKSLQD